MNNILDKGHNSCSSCGVCAVACPKDCIKIKLNTEGFYQPIVNDNICIECGICKQVCYKYLPFEDDLDNCFRNKEILAAWSNDDSVLKTASSGGVGHELLVHAINSNYKVSGVVFNAKKSKCEHLIAKTIDEVSAFKSSKYLQSYTVAAFSSFIKGEKYIVVGTPCQIYGLRKLIQLQKREDDFILIDFFCHGTPSKLLWNKYEEYIKDKFDLKDFKTVSFRSKHQSSWHSYAMKIDDVNGKKYIQTQAFANDMFFKFFLSDTCLNESCYKCLLRLDNCASDIRLADFWGDKYKNNEEGVSLVSLNTVRGKEFFSEIEDKLKVEKCSFDDLNNSQGKRFGIITNRRKIVIAKLQSEMRLLKIITTEERIFFFLDFFNRIIRVCSRGLRINNKKL